MKATTGAGLVASVPNAAGLVTRGTTGIGIAKDA